VNFGKDWSPRDWYFFAIVVGLALCGITHEGCEGVAKIRAAEHGVCPS